MATYVSSVALAFPWEATSGTTGSFSQGSANRYLFGGTAWATFGSTPTISALKYGGSGGTDITPGDAATSFLFGNASLTAGGVLPGPSGSTTIYGAGSPALQGAGAGVAYEGVASVADFTSNSGAQGDVTTTVASVTVPNCVAGQTVVAIIAAAQDSLALSAFTAVAGTTIRAQSVGSPEAFIGIVVLEKVAAASGSVTLSVNCNSSTTGAIGWAAKGVRLVDAAGGTDGTASGVTVSASSSLVAGGKGGGAGGQALSATASLVAGSASGVRNPTAAGQTLSTTASLIAGTGSGQRNGTAAGATLTATSSLVAGSAIGASAGDANLRSISSTTYGNRTNTTVTAPSGVVNGDVLVWVHVIGVFGTPPSVTPPAGFTLLPGFPSSVADDQGFQLDMRVAYKIASGESGDYTATHANASAQAAMLCISGGLAAAPAVTISKGDDFDGHAGITSTATSITTQGNGALVAFLAHNWNLYGSASPPTGTTPTFVERLDDATSLLYIATGVLASAGATGDKVQSDNLNGANEPWTAVLLSVASAASNPTAAGATVSATSSLVAGSASGQTNATAGGATISVSSSIVAGSATGGATAAGQTLTATASLTAGGASAGGSGTAAGATLTATSSLAAGSASGVRSPTAAGATVSAAASLVVGAASGQVSGSASGVTLAAAATLQQGSASGSGNATAGGAILQAQAALLPGAASGQRDGTATGVIVSVAALLLAGGASGPLLAGTRGFIARAAVRNFSARIVRRNRSARAA